MRKQRGVSLIGMVVVLSLLGFVGLMAAKCMPAYLEYMSVKKIFKQMADGGDLKGSVRDIRTAYERRNGIEDVKSVRGPDLEITKEGGETVVSATWSVKVPLVYNFNACLDFSATSSGQPRGEP